MSSVTWQAFKKCHKQAGQGLARVPLGHFLGKVFNIGAWRLDAFRYQFNFTASSLPVEGILQIRKRVGYSLGFCHGKTRRNLAATATPMIGS